MSEANPLCLFWEGFEPGGWSERPDGTLVLTLSACPRTPPRCGGCRRPVSLVHAHGRRWIRERDLIDRRLWLDVPVRRLRCGHCGIRTEHIPWLAGRRALYVRRLQGDLRHSPPTRPRSEALRHSPPTRPRSEAL